MYLISYAHCINQSLTPTHAIQGSDAMQVRIILQVIMQGPYFKHFSA
jgi:hypothetical protein